MAKFSFIVYNFLKWLRLQVGEGEKLMKALFAVAAARQPSVIFIDEVILGHIPCVP